MSKLLFTFLLMSFWGRYAFAQSYTLAQKIIDKGDAKGIPYATIQLHPGEQNTISNADGDFAIAVAHPASDSVYISCIGYEPLRISVKEIQERQEPIALQANSIYLDEVIVSNLQPWQILKQAIAHTDSLVAPKAQLQAYYREFATLDKALFKYSEAELHYRIACQGKKTKATAYVGKYQILTDSVADEKDWKSQIESTIDPNTPLKEFYQFDYLQKFVEEKNIDKFDYNLENKGGITKITISPKEEIHKPLPDAVIYLNRKEHRIVKTEYGYNSHLQYIPKINILIIKFSYEKYKNTCIYSSEGPAYLQYGKMEFDFRFKYGKKSGLWGSKIELLIQNNDDQTNISAMKKFDRATLPKSSNKDYAPIFDQKYQSILPSKAESAALKNKNW